MQRGPSLCEHCKENILGGRKEILGGTIISLEGNTSEEGKKFYWGTFNKTHEKY